MADLGPPVPLVGEGVLVEDVDEGRDDDGGVAADGLEQRLQPAGRALDVRVEEDEHGARGGARAVQPRADQALALLVAHHAHLLAEVGRQVAGQRRGQVG